MLNAICWTTSGLDSAKDMLASEAAQQSTEGAGGGRDTAIAQAAESGFIRHPGPGRKRPD